MVILYSAVLLMLVVTAWLVGRRARGLEAKYVRASVQAKQLQDGGKRDVNSSRNDPFAAAKRQYELGKLVDLRDRIEAGYLAWQTRRDRLDKLVAVVRDWRGKKLPYSFGLIDMSALMYTVDYVTRMDPERARVVMEYLMALLR